MKGACGVESTPGRVLAGFFTKVEGVAYLRYATMWETPPATADLEEMWRRSRSAIECLPPFEHGELALTCPDVISEQTSENATVRALLRELEGMQPKVLLVPIAYLVTHQVLVNADYVRALKEQSAQFAEPSDMIDYCFPQLEDTAADVLQGQHTFVSDNPNLKVLGIKASVATHDLLGTEHPTASVMVGVGNQGISVALFGGRLIVVNGYHRLLALYESGHREAPVVLIQPRDQSDLSVLKVPPAGSLPWFQLPLLTAMRPPLLRDFANAEIALEVRMPKIKKVIDVQFQVIERVVWT